MRCFIVFLCSLAGLTVSASEPARAWPNIQQVDITFSLNWNDDKVHVDAPIFGVDGKVLYRLICRGVSDKYLDQIDQKLGVNYVGPLMCILNEGNIESDLSLLREGSDKAWFTRGQFRESELMGKCGDYPEYGRLRHFHLRGFVLTFEVLDVEFHGEEPSFDFKITAHDESSATSAISAPSGFKDPRHKGAECGE